MYMQLFLDPTETAFHLDGFKFNAFSFTGGVYPVLKRTRQ